MNKNSYVLTININGGMEGNNPIANTEESATLPKVNHGEAAIFTTYLVAKPFIEKTKQVIENNAHVQYANSEYEQRQALMLDVIDKGTGILAGVAAGRSLASLLGLAGSTGALIGGVVAVAGIVADIAVKQNSINNARILENEQLDILRGRAGVQFNRSRGGQ